MAIDNLEVGIDAPLEKTSMERAGELAVLNSMQTIIQGDNKEFFDNMGQGADFMYSRATPASKELMSYQDNNLDTVRMTSNMEALARVYKKDRIEIATNYDDYSKRFSTEYLNKADQLNDTELFNGINKLTGDIKQKDEEDKTMRNEMFTQVKDYLFDDKGGRQKFHSEVLSQADIPPEDMKRIVGLTDQYFDEIQDRRKNHLHRANELVQLIKEKEGAEITDPKFKLAKDRRSREAYEHPSEIVDSYIENIIKEASQLPEKEQDRFLWVLNEVTNREGGVVEGFVQSNMQSFSRTLGNMLESSGEFYKGDLITAVHDLKENPKRLATRALGNAGILGAWAADKIGAEATSLKEASPQEHSRQEWSERVRNMKGVVAKLDTDAVDWRNSPCLATR